MKKIDIVIPTLNRLEKLYRALGSIPPKDWIGIKIIFDNDPIRKPDEKDKFSCPQQSEFIRSAWYRKQVDDRAASRMHINSMCSHRGSVDCRNSMMPYCDDGVLPATDDVVFRPGAFEKMLAQFNETFPDDDGVLGVRQDREGHHPTGVCLVGQAFLQRYPGKLLYYPRYFHFAAQEIWWHAETIKKFAMTEAIMLDHFHPGFMPAEMDETHKITASHRTLDHAIRNARKKAGSIWGLDE